MTRAPGAARPTVVVALGGNALLRRGEPPEAQAQQRAAREAAQLLAPVSRATRLVVTHGNGPQVGLLALTGAAADVAPYPLDVLGAETEGQIGYVVELELDNAIDHQDTVAVVTRTEVDPRDPAFADPSKFIGPVYDEVQAHSLARDHGWTVKPDGEQWRRVVASPEPRRIVQLAAIRDLVDHGFLVVCAGGGGVPVVRAADGRHAGVEAVVDKDLASSLLARGLGAELLVLATDVDAVYADWGTPEQRPLHAPSPDELRALDLPAGSMGPKAQAAIRFVEGGGARAAIGALADVERLVAGTAGTQVTLGREPD